MVDLHLHVDGSLPLYTVRRLARNTDVELPQDDLDLRSVLTVPSQCRNLSQYLQCFDLPISLMQSEDNIYLAFRDLCEAIKDELDYAELRFAPQLHTQGGLTQEQVYLAAKKGVEDSGMFANIIFCLMRGASFDKNRETVELAGRYLNDKIVALDLAGDENAFATDLYKLLFEKAAYLGIPYTIHAGEAAGIDSIQSAISLGARRIGHGVRSVENFDMVKTLAKKAIPLELCFTSNIQTRAIKCAEDFPIDELMSMGVLVTVNTDNRTVSDTTLKREFSKLNDLGFITESKQATIVKNSIEAAFLTNTQKVDLLSKSKLR